MEGNDADEGRVERFATGILAVLLVILVLSTIAIIVIPKQGEKFTEFYILGPDGKATNYPVRYNLGDEKPIIVGISNHEYRNVTYDLVVMLNNSNKFTQIYSDQVILDQNQTLEKKIMLKPDQKGDNMMMDFNLYIDGNMSAPYRNLNLWISVN